MKIIERIMHSQLLEYFQAGNLTQSGLRPNHSTSTALISAVNLCLANMDAGKLNGSVFIDLKTQYCPLRIARLRSLAAIFLMLKNRKK